MVNRREAVVGGFIAASGLVSSWPAHGGPVQSTGWKIEGIKRDNCSFFLQASNDFIRDLGRDPAASEPIREVRCPLCKELIVLKAVPTVGEQASAIS